MVASGIRVTGSSGGGLGASVGGNCGAGKYLCRHIRVYINLISGLFPFANYLVAAFPNRLKLCATQLGSCAT